MYIIPGCILKKLFVFLDKKHTNAHRHTKQQCKQFIFLLGVWDRTRIDRVLALTNNKLRQPYSSATTLDFEVLPRMANRVDTCEKALNASGPQAP